MIIQSSPFKKKPWLHLPSGNEQGKVTAEVWCCTIRTEVSREGKRRVWARQRGRGGGQDQTFPVACTTTIKKKRQMHVNITVSKSPQQSCVCLCACCYAEICAFCGCTYRWRRSRRVQMRGSLHEHNCDKENSISSVIHPCLPPLSRDKKWGKRVWNKMRERQI